MQQLYCFIFQSSFTLVPVRLIFDAELGGERNRLEGKRVEEMTARQLQGLRDNLTPLSDQAAEVFQQQDALLVETVRADRSIRQVEEGMASLRKIVGPKLDKSDPDLRDALLAVFDLTEKNKVNKDKNHSPFPRGEPSPYSDKAFFGYRIQKNAGQRSHFWVCFFNFEQKRVCKYFCVNGLDIGKGSLAKV